MKATYAHPLGFAADDATRMYLIIWQAVMLNGK
jgi:hypothetical protein